MAEPNVAVVQRAFEAYWAGDMEAVLALCDEDILVTQAPEVPGVPPQQRGRPGVVEAFSLWPEQWDDFTIRIDRVTDLPGGYVMVVNRQTGRGRQSGVEVDAEFTFVFAVRAGLITEWRIFMTEEDARGALGLSG
jgi:ketosteroid isomerase-like protein